MVHGFDLLIIKVILPFFSRMTKADLVILLEGSLNFNNRSSQGESYLWFMEHAIIFELLL